MLPIRRHPVIHVADRVLTRRLGIPRQYVIPILALCFLAGPAPLAEVAAAALVVLGSFAAVAWAHGALLAWGERIRRFESRERFLCPHCLRFGGFHLACGTC